MNIEKENELLKKIKDTSLSKKEREKAMVKLSVLKAKRDGQNEPLEIILLMMILLGLLYFLNN